MPSSISFTFTYIIDDGVIIVDVVFNSSQVTLEEVVNANLTIEITGIPNANLT